MNEELPKFIYIGSIIGLVLLGVSLIIFIIYMSMFNQARDTNATVTRLEIPKKEKALMVSYIVIGAIGFLFCLLIPYGHYLKSKNDPSVVISKNNLHFERTNVEEKKIEAFDLKKTNRYKKSNRTNNIKSRKGNLEFL